MAQTEADQDQAESREQLSRWLEQLFTEQLCTRTS